MEEREGAGGPRQGASGERGLEAGNAQGSGSGHPRTPLETQPLRPGSEPELWGWAHPASRRCRRERKAAPPWEGGAAPPSQPIKPVGGPHTNASGGTQVQIRLGQPPLVRTVQEHIGHLRTRLDSRVQNAPQQGAQLQVTHHSTDFSTPSTCFKG